MAGHSKAYRLPKQSAAAEWVLFSRSSIGVYSAKKAATREQKSKHTQTVFTGRETAVLGSKYAKHSKTPGQGSFHGCLSAELNKLIFVSVSDRDSANNLVNAPLAAGEASTVLLLHAIPWH